MKSIVRSIWVLSLLIFLSACLIAYTFHPLYVDVIMDESGKGLYFMEKNNFFYVCIGIAVAINGGFSAIAGTIPFFSRKLLPIPNARYWTASLIRRKELLIRVKMSFRMLATVVNLLLLLLVRYIFILNEEGQIKWGWLIYFIPALLVLWAVLSFYLFRDVETKSD